MPYTIKLETMNRELHFGKNEKIPLPKIDKTSTHAAV